MDRQIGSTGGKINVVVHMPCGARGIFYCVGAPFSSTSVHCTYYIHIPRQHTSPLDSSPCRGARAHESERGFSLRGKVRQEIHGEERERAAVAGGTERGRKRAGRWVEGGEREKPLTHNTIRRLRLLRWILKDPRDYYFFLFFHFHSSIIISEE